MPFKAVLIDIDNTLLDFRASSYDALVECFGAYGVRFTEQDMRRYEVYNDALWCAFERGEVEREMLFIRRFELYFAERGLDLDPVAFNEMYLKGLARGAHLMPHALELLRWLHGRYRVFVVTNGDAYAQRSRMALSGVGQYLDDAFISEELGCRKPEAAFFDRVFAAIGEEYRACSLLVGDSLSSDMQGGRNAGIPTCFYGDPAKADERCDYVITDLLQLKKILENS